MYDTEIQPNMAVFPLWTFIVHFDLVRSALSWFLASDEVAIISLCKLQNKCNHFFFYFFEYVAIPLLVHCFSWLIFLSFADLKVKVRDASGMWCPARCTYAVILFLCPSRRLLLCTLTYQHYPTHITILLSSGKQWYHSAPCCVFSLILLFHR